MKDNKIIRVVLVLAIAFAIRFIGIDRIPPTAIVGIFLFGMIYFMWNIFRVKKDKYYIIFALNLIALSGNTIIMYTVKNKYPQYMSVSRPIFIPIFLTLLVSTFISVIIWSIASNKK
ncbi:hypothetical protein [Clostridium sp.]|jgi:hypothetical protein|uniref:hypothetical protein n=1 Tax=Clostridium sp. TaxID=1506 RepID=UPI003EE88275